MRILHSTTPHYTRCIKPNPHCKPLTFIKEEVNALVIGEDTICRCIYTETGFYGYFLVLLGYHAVGGLWNCRNHTH